jgi:hypothetical protein
MHPPLLAPFCLVVGALLGLAGAFIPSASLRGLAWGLDGVALVTAGATLLVHHYRQGHDIVATGFVVFTVGQGLVLSGAALSPEASIPSFAAGAALWSASLGLVSAPRVFPTLVRVLGFVAALLFAATALQVFAGRALTPLSEPLPFFAYPFLVCTLLGWAWASMRGQPSPEAGRRHAEAAMDLRR